MIRIGLCKFGFLRMTLVACVGIPLIIASNAFAQNLQPMSTDIGAAPTPSAAEAERIIVTGSNIPTAEEVGPNPVDIYNRENINKSGEFTTERFLQSLPIANANIIPTSNNENGSNTAVGAATIALRGFDARATLILLDGRRVAVYPTGNNPGLVNMMFVDLNSIPQAAIESIEILKDGASTTYGADAVAGVVNLKMRHNYDGAEARIQYGNTLDKDSGELDASAIFGVGNKDTNITGVLNYYHRNSIFNHDRGFSLTPPFLSSNNSPYNLQLSSDVAGAAGGKNLNPGGTEFASAPDFTNGLAPANRYLYDANARVRAAGGLRPGFNFNLFSSSLPESERYGAWFSADRKVFGDQMVVYADGFYQNVNTHNELAAPATGSFETKGQTILAIPPHSPIAPGSEPPNTPTHAETGVPADAFNPFNPFEQIISGGTRARLAEFGNRLFDNETDAWLSTIGIKGDKLFDGSWGYDTGFRYSQLDNAQTGTQVSASRFNRILNQADPIFDPTSPQFIGTTVAFNPFGDYRQSNLVQFGHGRVRQSAPQGRGHLKVGHVRCHHLHNRPLSPAGWRRWLSHRWSMAAGATERESRYAQFGGRHRWQLASSRCSGQPKFLCDLRRDQNSYLQPRDEYLLQRRRQKSKKSATRERDPCSNSRLLFPGVYRWGAI